MFFFISYRILSYISATGGILHKTNSISSKKFLIFSYYISCLLCRLTLFDVISFLFLLPSLFLFFSDLFCLYVSYIGCFLLPVQSVCIFLFIFRCFMDSLFLFLCESNSILHLVDDPVWDLRICYNYESDMIRPFWEIRNPTGIKLCSPDANKCLSLQCCASGLCIVIFGGFFGPQIRIRIVNFEISGSTIQTTRLQEM